MSDIVERLRVLSNERPVWGAALERHPMPHDQQYKFVGLMAKVTAEDADEIERLSARLEEARGALGPFAKYPVRDSAADDSLVVGKCSEGRHFDLRVEHFRKARAALKDKP